MTVVSRRLVLSLLAIVLGGCAGAPSRDPSAGARVVAAAQRMLGAPYRFGGASPLQGFDCSGLVQYSHARAGLRAPRTVAEQKRRATPLNGDDLRPGDLVFFNTDYKGGHVGIFIGGHRFIHAPSSGGRVRIDSLDAPYWRRHFDGGGRIPR